MSRHRAGTLIGRRCNMSIRMVALLQSALRDAPSLPVQHATNGADVSSGKFAVPFDMMRFKTVFPTRWSAFLRAHFQSSAHVAFFFGVDDRTARHWLDGTTAPSGAVAIVACARIEGAVDFLMGQAA